MRSIEQVIERLHCRKLAAADENRESSEEELLCLRKQFVAPLDGIAQGLLPYRQIAWPPG